jgi:hypothetical protein
MKITQNGKRIALKGICDQVDMCPEIGAKKLLNLVQHGGVTCCLQMGVEQDEMLLSDFYQNICSIQAAEIVKLPEQIQQLL